MTKRITASFLVLAVLLLSGCNNNRRLTPEEYEDELQSRLTSEEYRDEPQSRLTPEEYRDELKRCVRDFGSAVMDINLDQQAFGESGVRPSDFEEHCKAFEKAINSFEKINPPVEMEQRHKWFLEAFDYEREWLEAVRDLMSTKTSAKKKKAEQKIKDIATAAVNKKAYMMRYVEILTELPRDDMH